MGEQRRHRRSPGFGVAGIEDLSERRRWVALTTDVSRSGMACRTRARVEVGDEVHVHLVHRGAPRHERARVVRITVTPERLHTRTVALEFC